MRLPEVALGHLYKFKDKDGQVVMLWVAGANSCPWASGAL